MLAERRFDRRLVCEMPLWLDSRVDHHDGQTAGAAVLFDLQVVTNRHYTMQEEGFPAAL